ncbi:MAG TPA: GDP-mannose 4,6-dehydratase [Planctomycetota bacterium]|nr:GDP-mannose 4,6-dehydratase [Planctomycetota bacterium]
MLAMKILVTGGAGFIGSHACEHLLSRGHAVVALDNFDPYYSPALKRANLSQALAHSNFKLVEGDFGDRACVAPLMQHERFDVVLHLGAQAGVRPSIADPLKYQRVNVAGSIVLLEAMREIGLRKIVAASTSTVYGNDTPAPFREEAPCMQPVSPYAATKRCMEIFLGTYCALHGFQATALRFFTVYGPRQRPDMAIAPFTKKMLAGEAITLFGDGSTSRDYTYVSDIVEGVTASIERVADPSPPAPLPQGERGEQLSASKAEGAFCIYNLGGENPVTLSDLIAAMEKATGCKAIIQRAPMQSGDVERTFADISKARLELGYEPKISLAEGLARTVEWVKARMG